MFKIPKQEYAAELNEGAAQQVSCGEGIRAVARELGLLEQTLRDWAKAAKARKLHPAGGKAVTPEQMELSRVWVEDARLKMGNKNQNKRRYTSRRIRYEVRRDRSAEEGAPPGRRCVRCSR